MDYRREYEKWLASPALTEEERAELRAIADDEREIRERFYAPLSFGTAGLRGTMKVGLHQMNRFIVRWATQGFADVIAAEGEEAKRRGVVICMDCRNHSDDFARSAACVMAANGIINGVGNRKISPKTDASRAQVATMLMRYDSITQ